MTSIAYALPAELEMIRKAEQARLQRERAIAAGIIKDTLPRGLRNKITSARQRLADAQQAAAKVEMELQVHLKQQPSEQEAFKQWLYKRFELESYVPVARRKVEHEQAALDAAVQEARRVLLRAWSERVQAADAAYEAEEARLEQLRQDATQRREDVHNARTYVEAFDGGDL